MKLIKSIFTTSLLIAVLGISAMTAPHAPAQSLLGVTPAGTATRAVWYVVMHPTTRQYSVLTNSGFPSPLGNALAQGYIQVRGPLTWEDAWAYVNSNR